MKEQIEDLPTLWLGRAIELLKLVNCQLDGDISKLTAGWVIDIIHDKTGAVDPEFQSVMVEILSSYPGYIHSTEGFYHHTFFRQLEFVCETARIYRYLTPHVSE